MNKTLVVEFAGVAGSGKSFLAEKVKRSLSQQGFHATYNINPKINFAQRLFSIGLALRTLLWVHKTKQNSPARFLSAFALWFRLQCTIKQLRRRDGIHLIDEGFVHKFRTIRRHSETDIVLGDVWQPGFYASDLLIVVKAGAEVIGKRRKARDGLDLAAEELRTAVNRVAYTIRDAEVLRSKISGFEYMVIDNGDDAAADEVAAEITRFISNFAGYVSCSQ